jgi:hypothetical protein
VYSDSEVRQEFTFVYGVETESAERKIDDESKESAWVPVSSAVEQPLAESQRCRLKDVNAVSERAADFSGNSETPCFPAEDAKCNFKFAGFPSSPKFRYSDLGAAAMPLSLFSQKFHGGGLPLPALSNSVEVDHAGRLKRSHLWTYSSWNISELRFFV